MHSKLFDLLPKGAISEILIKRITDALIAGDLKPGDKLPTEMEFKERLAIGRNSVREAIKVLVAFGVLEIRRSEGTFVVKECNQKLLDPIVYGLILSNKSPEDLLEFKVTFLSSTISMAMKKVNPNQIERCYELAEKFKGAMLSEDSNLNYMYDTSVDFNAYLGEIACNPLIEQLNSIVIKIAKYSRIKAIENSIKFNKKEALPNLYFAIVDYIKTGNRASLSELEDKILAVWKDLI